RAVAQARCGLARRRDAVRGRSPRPRAGAGDEPHARERPLEVVDHLRRLEQVPGVRGQRTGPLVDAAARRDEPEAVEAEVPHGPGGGAHVRRVLRPDEHDPRPAHGGELINGVMVRPAWRRASTRTRPSWPAVASALGSPRTGSRSLARSAARTATKTTGARRCPASGTSTRAWCSWAWPRVRTAATALGGCSRATPRETSSTPPCSEPGWRASRTPPIGATTWS